MSGRRAVDLFLHETAARQQIRLTRGGTTTVRLRAGRPVQVLELPAAAAFHEGSAVPLPLAPDGGPLDLLGGLATLLDALERGPARELLVAAHVPGDEEGGLSRARARAVEACLRGDRAAFGAACAERALTRDWQRVLAWTAIRRGWDCDPGAIDDHPGPRAQCALRALLERHAEASGETLPEADAPSAADWGALLAVYDEALAELLELGPGELEGLRERLRPVHAPVGCGPSWPLDRVRIGSYAGTADARVDLLLFEAKDAPQLLCHEDPDAPCDWKRCDVYRKNKYVREELAPVAAEDGLLELLVVNAQQRPLASLAGELIFPDGSRRAVVSDEQGVIRQRIAPHTEARLSFPELDAPPRPAPPRPTPPGAAPEPVSLTLSRTREATDPPPAQVAFDTVLELFAQAHPQGAAGTVTWAVQGTAIALADGDLPAGEQVFAVAVEAGFAVVVASFASAQGEAEARWEVEVTALTPAEPPPTPGLRGPAVHSPRHPDPEHECDPPLKVSELNYGELAVHSSCRGQVALWVYDEGGSAAFTPAHAETLAADGFVFDDVTWKVNGNTRVTLFVAGGQLRMHTCAGTLASLRGHTRPTTQPAWIFGSHRMPPKGARPELVP